mmetsp:Transcript_28947/g.63692  ORF Transcript_28947/g.63692 Transcript_28947/m.63692 type:complete len:246 (-) Transcript_28947:1-738(-)
MPAAVNADDTSALPMHPRSFVERCPMRHSARSQATPLTSPVITVTPSSCASPTSERSTDCSAACEVGVIVDRSEAACTMLGALSPFAGIPGSFSKPGGGWSWSKSAREEEGGSSGVDLAFGSPRGVSSGPSEPSTLRLMALCSSLSFRTSSSALFFQSSSSVTLCCRCPTVRERNWTHCAREAACCAAMSAWYWAWAALTACMLPKSIIDSCSQGDAPPHIPPGVPSSALGSMGGEKKGLPPAVP